MTYGEKAGDDPSAGQDFDRVSRGPEYGHVAGRNDLIYAQRFERVVSAMNRRLDLPMSNSKMADIACLSPCHFNRLFRHATGIPPIQFHYALRLDRAKRLLVSTDLSITEICFEVGYNSLGTFTSRFNQLVGLSPSAFRSLTRKFESVRLGDLSARLLELACAPALSRSICGEVSDAVCDGLIFTALFPRAIPEGIPAACALTSAGAPYYLPHPGCGVWHVFAVAIPWTTAGTQLITLDGLQRGHSGPIHVEVDGWSGASQIELNLARTLDPPVLSAVPVLLSRIFADHDSRLSFSHSPEAGVDALHAT